MVWYLFGLDGTWMLVLYSNTHDLYATVIVTLSDANFLWKADETSPMPIVTHRSGGRYPFLAWNQTTEKSTGSPNRLKLGYPHLPPSKPLYHTSTKKPCPYMSCTFLPWLPPCTFILFVTMYFSQIGPLKSIMFCVHFNNDTNFVICEQFMIPLIIEIFLIKANPGTI